VNTEELEQAKILIEEFLERNTLHSECLWQLKKIIKDISGFIDSIDITYGRKWI
jgi:hypothetical protein